MSTQHPDIVEIIQRDPRYMYEAYEFMFEALTHTQKMLGRSPSTHERDPGQHHVTGPELIRGAIDLAKQQFGMLARTVFRMWGIRKSDDIGEIIFNLIEARMMCKTEEDDRSDFHDVCDLDRILCEGVTIPVNDVTWSKRGIQ